jgi:hypothetical protein
MWSGRKDLNLRVPLPRSRTVTMFDPKVELAVMSRRNSARPAMGPASPEKASEGTATDGTTRGRPADGLGGRPMSNGVDVTVARRPIVNTHIHLPPNFSAFATVNDAIAQAAAEGLRVLGASNYHDFRVYDSFDAAAVRHDIVALFGMEIICLVEDLQRNEVKANDPDNPGRMYLCGNGITGVGSIAPQARALIARMRAVNEERIRRITGHLREIFAGSGFVTTLSDQEVASHVADRAGVPREWVVLQERHVARAFQEELFRAVEPTGRVSLLERALAVPFTANVEDPWAVQDAIRSKLMKAGRPAFEPEAPISFEDACGLILGLGGIPSYPILADGAMPICGFEDTPEALVERMLERGLYCADVIPGRNRRETVDRYVRALSEAGIVAVAGTEHNTLRRLSLEPRCVGDEPLSEFARDAFWKGTCVVAAHQYLGRRGRPGYVGGDGRRSPGFKSDELRMQWFRELGDEVIRAGPAMMAGR